MRILSNRNGITKGIITKVQALKALKSIDKALPTHPGVTISLAAGVDLTKIRNPGSGAIKQFFILVGCKSTIEEFAATLA